MSIDLKAIRERADAAAPGPWRYQNNFGHLEIVADGRDHFRPIAGHYGIQEVDATFIAKARDDVPALLDLVDAMTGALLGSERAAECGGCLECCPVCRMCLIVTVADDGEHAEGCPLDAALTLAGFPDFASRDAERARRARP